MILQTKLVYVSLAKQLINNIEKYNQLRIWRHKFANEARRTLCNMSFSEE